MSGFETITAGDGGARAYVTGDAAPGGSGVVVFHAWWGLHGDILAFADRLAALGYAVIAPDLVSGRTAATVEEAEALSEGADEAHADAVALAAVDTLAARLGPDPRMVTVGFSFGVPWAVWSAAERDLIRGTVAYYGTLQGGALARAGVPVLGHFAADDPFEPAEAVAAFESALRDAGREVVIHRYPGTGHWFCEPSRDAYRSEAADLAFERTVAFLRRVTA